MVGWGDDSAHEALAVRDAADDSGRPNRSSVASYAERDSVDAELRERGAGAPATEREFSLTPRHRLYNRGLFLGKKRRNLVVRMSKSGAGASRKQ